MESLQSLIKSFSMSADKVAYHLKKVGDGNMLKGVQKAYNVGMAKGALYTASFAAVSLFGYSVYNSKHFTLYRAKRKCKKLKKAQEGIEAEDFENGDSTEEY